MLQTLKLNNKKTEKIIFLRRKKFRRIDSRCRKNRAAYFSFVAFQYLLGKYFSAPTGEEQIRWLLGPKTPDSSELAEVQRIGIHDFNASVKLFRLEGLNNFLKK